jgi:hypothetical protein
MLGRSTPEVSYELGQVGCAQPVAETPWLTAPGTPHPRFVGLVGRRDAL